MKMTVDDLKTSVLLVTLITLSVLVIGGCEKYERTGPNEWRRCECIDGRLDCGKCDPNCIVDGFFVPVEDLAEVFE